MNKNLLDELASSGWCPRPKNFQFPGWHSDYRLFKNGHCLLIIDDTMDKAHITADLLGPYICGLATLYYGYINNETHDRIRGLYRWSLKTYIPTVCI